MRVIVLAAGKGTRMLSDNPKVLHEVQGRPVLQHVLETLASLGFHQPYVVVGSGADRVCSFLKQLSSERKINPVVIRQTVRKGTGHAVMMAARHFKTGTGDVLIWPGDMPLVKTETLRELIRRHRALKSQASVLSSYQEEPFGYGRILRKDGIFAAIREEKEATAEERAVREVNSGIYLFHAEKLFKALKEIKPDNQKKELYLTDTIEVFVRNGWRTEAFALAGSEEGQGINDRFDLAKAEKIMTEREIKRHMKNGVTIVNPEQTSVAKHVVIGRDTVIYPWTWIEQGVKIGKKCRIGPFAKIRQGTVIDDEAVIGSFVEVTRSKIGKKVCAKHLSYLGDAEVGEGTNIGAGVVTANYDGKKKHRTKLGKNVLVGSNTVFVAPVRVPDRVRTGAGAVVVSRTSIKKGDVLIGVPARSRRKK